MKILDGSSLYMIARQSRHYENFIFTNDWEYVEIGFLAKAQSGPKKYRTKMVHYGVMSVKLPRKLPNVVFDSLKHQRRQFRVLFDPKQYIQLEGMFDKYFATYFHQEYTIDSLSFITPEVMEALIEADEYDIEIVHDRLLLFGPTKPDAQAQLEDMSKAVMRIRKKLLNNILTYRDERVPGYEGRQVVARTGMFLQNAPSGIWAELYLVWVLFKFFIIFVAIMILGQMLIDAL